MLAPQNILFAVALAVLLLIAILEGVGALFGAGLSHLLSSVLPDNDIALDLDGPDLEAQGPIGRVLSWLRIGQVPVLVLMIIFLAGFGIGGLVVQKCVLTVFGFLLPAIIAFIPALFLSLLVVRFLGGVLNKIIPKDETSAVSKKTFIGRVAIITLGTAKKNHAAQGKVKDAFGKFHYIMIEPDNEEDTFAQGVDVLLVRHSGGTFFAIANEKGTMKGSL